MPDIKEVATVLTDGKLYTHFSAGEDRIVVGMDENGLRILIRSGNPEITRAEPKIEREAVFSGYCDMIRSQQQ